MTLLCDLFVVRHLFTIFFCLLTLTAFVGNLLVVFAVYRTKQLHRIPHYFILSLACADLCVATVVLPPAIVLQHLSYWKPDMSSICCGWASADILLCTASIMNLSCISVDRYLAITRPMKYLAKRTVRKSMRMIAFAWIIPFFLIVPPMISGDTHKITDGLCNISLNLVFRIYASMIAFFLPFLLNSFLYSHIFLTVKRRIVTFPSGVRAKPVQVSKVTSLFENYLVYSLGLQDERSVITRKEFTRNVKPDSCALLLQYSEHRLGRKTDYNMFGDSANQALGCPHSRHCWKTEFFPWDKKLRAINTSSGLEVHSTVIENRERLTSESPHSCQCSSTFSSDILFDPLNVSLSLTKLPTFEVTSRKKSLSDSTLSLALTRVESKQLLWTNMETKADLMLTSSIPSQKDGCLGGHACQTTYNGTLAMNPEVYAPTPNTQCSSQRTRGNLCCTPTVQKEENNENHVSSSVVNIRSESDDICGYLRSQTCRSNLLITIQQGDLQSKRTYCPQLYRERKTLRTVTIVMACFTICWFPFFICFLGEAFMGVSYPYELMVFVTWLGYANSACNPFIYGLFDKRYAAVFKRMLTFRITRELRN
ncbi:uncharacterized protein DEA37_0007816 [Paragonimus westermani]|uniref:G-protein coupled receptors family 1 profile domain-containing protein n=1 Tax=Paragonimus westermani TaxID=34504 RepID=A0A5J4N4H3_9TREM|nr:uncharacterized protein DEA37_0007816 [Paragonimus westermani]